MSYKKGELEQVKHGQDWTPWDSRTEDYRNLTPGEVYLPHSCDEWVIGGEKEIKELIADLQAVLASRTAPRSGKKTNPTQQHH